jgi:hypothetical protein
MNYKTITVTQEVCAADILSMQAMSAKEYRGYLELGLVRVDEHGILRSVPAGYPLAVTSKQIKQLIKHLKALRSKMHDSH